MQKSFEISDAIQHQIDDELQRVKNEQSEALQKEFDIRAKKLVKKEVEYAVANEKQAAKLELEKERQSKKLAVEEAKHNTELEIERLRIKAADSEKSEKQLRKQQLDLLEELSKAEQAKENIELNARKALLDKEKTIREEAAKKAADDFNTKIREQEETINKLREQLTTAKHVAEQGSQQLQGEILELDIEQGLRLAFRLIMLRKSKKANAARIYAVC